MGGRIPIPVYVGTAGYAWPQWAGSFYPPGLPHDRMLAYYAGQLPFVEISSTFCRVPTHEQIERLIEQTPAGFQYCLKVPRTVSHELRVHLLRPFHQIAKALAAQHMLAGLLLELPDRFSDTPKHRLQLSRIAAGLYPHTVWARLPSRSWQRPRLPRWLAEHGLELVENDVPDLVESPCAAQRRRAYVRLEAPCTETELHNLSVRMERAAKGWRDAHVVFCSRQGTADPTNAVRFAQIMLTAAPGCQAVAPPRRTTPAQGELFIDQSQAVQLAT